MIFREAPEALGLLMFCYQTGASITRTFISFIVLYVLKFLYRKRGFIPFRKPLCNKKVVCQLSSKLIHQRLKFLFFWKLNKSIDLLLLTNNTSVRIPNNM